jgi:hypothetical protein
LQITVGGVDQVIPTIKLSEAGYAQLPHKNKYGADYGPEGDSYDHGLK